MLIPNTYIHTYTCVHVYTMSLYRLIPKTPSSLPRSLLPPSLPPSCHIVQQFAQSLHSTIYKRQMTWRHVAHVHVQPTRTFVYVYTLALDSRGNSGWAAGMQQGRALTLDHDREEPQFETSTVDGCGYLLHPAHAGTQTLVVSYLRGAFVGNHSTLCIIFRYLNVEL